MVNDTNSRDRRSRSGIRRRLTGLALMELANIPLQAAIWFAVIGLPMTAGNLLGFALCAVLLLEGAAYWTAKLRQLATGRAVLPAARVFAAARLVNVPLLAAGVLLTAWHASGTPAGVPGVLFALFAVLEHVNYFHTQLMYDTREDRRYRRERGLRRAHLARDLARAAQLRRRAAGVRGTPPSRTRRSTP